MTTDNYFRIQVDINPRTGKIDRAYIDRDHTGDFEEIDLDGEALSRLLQGGEAAKDIVANRTGPDPRRLAG